MRYSILVSRFSSGSPEGDNIEVEVRVYADDGPIAVITVKAIGLAAKIPSSVHKHLFRNGRRFFPPQPRQPKLSFVPVVGKIRLLSELLLASAEKTIKFTS